MRAPGSRSVLQRPVRPVSVVVIDVLAGNEPEMPITRDQHPVQAWRRALAIRLSAVAFARGARTGVLMTRAPAGPPRPTDLLWVAACLAAQVRRVPGERFIQLGGD